MKILLLMIASVMYVEAIAQTIYQSRLLDSSFTLADKVNPAKSDVNQHGIIFYAPAYKPLSHKQVIKDLDFIKGLSFINLTKYKREVFRDSNHLIKIWTSKNPNEKVLKIVEINSTYFIDTVEENEPRLIDTIVYNNYYLQLKNTTKNIWFESVNKQGVSEYSIGNKKVFIAREMILKAPIFIDRSEDIKSLVKRRSDLEQIYRGIGLKAK